MRKISLPPYKQIALIFQGGGALGAYQAGVYEGVSQAGIDPHWVAGISIGAINAAIVAAGLTGFWTQLIYGLVIIASVSFFSIIRRVVRR